jgi:hypothetical protein
MSLIVASEVVWDDVAIEDVVGELEGGDDTGPPRLSVRFAQDAESAEVDEIFLEHVADGGAQDCGTVAVEELAGAGSHETEVELALEPALEQRLDVGDLGDETISTLEVPSGLLFLEQVGAVLGLLEDLFATPGARVMSHLAFTVE